MRTRLRYRNIIAHSTNYPIEYHYQLLPTDEIIKMQCFAHEQLDVYQTAIEFVVLIEPIVKQFPKGRAYLIGQLQRAGTSVVLNIAEGAYEFSTNEKIRFYRMARRSATECAGILDICRRLNLIDENIPKILQNAMFWTT